MPRNIICDLDQVEPATWMIGNLTTGDQVALCDADLIMWCLAHLETTLQEAGKAAVAAKWAPAPAETTPEAGRSTERPKSDRKRSGGRQRPDGAVSAGQEGQEAEAAEGPADQERCAQGLAQAPASADDR